MFANSQPIQSSQQGPHARLREVVQKHLHTEFLRPPSQVSLSAFAGLAAKLSALPDPKPLILDTGCGTGVSTLALARQHADCHVIGIDKSELRLAQGQRLLQQPGAPKNASLLRCDLGDFWRLAAQAGWRVRHQYLLYPNPWPKPEHLKRRWHAHPVFPSLLALGGTLELRCNWRIYADEFAQALDCAGIVASVEEFIPEMALTPFEHKYQASAHTLWRCRALIPNR
ncbi:methyltransferase domain-containing protein [Pseudolysobacter antarcticus]|uniref:tRNA (guanine(46)-N(7))-methyltransferase n=1 Tax=Pseudolysobacter antarcticus TaxID=2511995 RepID=A0A411HKT4_9GAMM|nr:methyltransferase domain-containing protein [Pseudolysobacter antarcticus]QBB71142.1 methyltransferase domain-containing protein [Pseudolysobacter antarcticus]